MQSLVVGISGQDRRTLWMELAGPGVRSQGAGFCLEVQEQG